MSELAVPHHKQDKINMSSSNGEIESNFQESLHSETDLSEDPRILLRESKSYTIFLTKTAGMFIIYTSFFVLVNMFIIFDVVRSKTFNRSMNMKYMVWVYFCLAIAIKLLGSFGNSCFAKLQTVLFLLDIVFSSLTFFGLYWWCETINSNAYEYSGHFVIITGFCLNAMSYGFLFSTLISRKDRKYSILAGIVIMGILIALALGIVHGIWTIQTMKFGHYAAVWCAIMGVGLYIAFNSHFIVNMREEKYYDDEFIYCFFCYFTDWFSMFWIDLCKSMTKKKKKKSKKDVVNVEKN